MPSRNHNPSKITGKSQKGQQVLDFTEDQAREHFEKLRWPNGPICVHCGCTGEHVTRLQGTSARPGTFQCNACRQQFTVTVGTIMEDSHLPLATWLRAFHFMCAAKKGISSLQLQRQLGLGSYRTAWHLAHRIREAMKCEPVAGMLKGTVECDEVYIGGKPRPGTGRHKRGLGTEKSPVLVVAERGGRIRRRVVPNVTAKNVKAAIREMVHKSAEIHTDENRVYQGLGNEFAGHGTVRHNAGEYARDGVHNNTAESSNALLKRGITGAFHHVSKEHLHRYLAEFDFRWDHRKLEDAQRRDLAVRSSEGKRLMYRQPVQEPS